MTGLARPIPTWHRPSKGDPTNQARILTEMGRPDLASQLQPKPTPERVTR